MFEKRLEIAPLATSRGIRLTQWLSYTDETHLRGLCLSSNELYSPNTFQTTTKGAITSN
ncbi:MAG: hypothetical protein KME40_25010 [Komarekiella atlantica HA4396-MV6]|nr:hypothetical protein [Komarekiella atlantica HA4396-MV6]